MGNVCSVKGCWNDTLFTNLCQKHKCARCPLIRKKYYDYCNKCKCPEYNCRQAKYHKPPMQFGINESYVIYNHCLKHLCKICDNNKKLSNNYCIKCWIKIEYIYSNDSNYFQVLPLEIIEIILKYLNM